MIRTMIVDDEDFSLLNLEKKLQVFPNIEVIGKYSTHEKILEDLKKEAVDTIFLDIEMGEVSGIQLAQEILSTYPSIKIVFVSGHMNYAVDAFELESIDYLLKPVTVKRLEKTITRLQNRNKEMLSPILEVANKQRLKIYCFGELHVYFDEKPISFKTAKVKELFALLTAQMGKYVHRDIIIEKLWPGHNYKNAKTYLHTSLSHLRKLLSELGFPNAISFLNQCYCLILESIYFDVEEFNRLVNNAFNDNLLDHKAIERAIELYKGAFLEVNCYEWVYEFSEPFQERILHLLTVALKDIKHNNPEKAISYLKIHQKIEPYSEYVVLNFMQIYAEMGMRLEAIRTYQSYAKLLEEEMAIYPTPKIRDLYFKLLN